MQFLNSTNIDVYDTISIYYTSYILSTCIFIIMVLSLLNCINYEQQSLYIIMEYLPHDIEFLIDDNKKLKNENINLQKTNKSLQECISILCKTNSGKTHGYNLRSKKH